MHQQLRKFILNCKLYINQSKRWVTHKNRIWDTLFRWVLRNLIKLEINLSMHYISINAMIFRKYSKIFWRIFLLKKIVFPDNYYFDRKLHSFKVLLMTYDLDTGYSGIFSLIFYCCKIFLEKLENQNTSCSL